MKEWLRRRKWWHWLSGHGRPTVDPFEPRLFEIDLINRGYGKYTAAELTLQACSMVVTRCSCGDEWVFYALGMYEQFVPEGGVLDLPDPPFKRAD